MPKMDKKYPYLCAPNDGYDENDRWMGMTPEEVDAKGEAFRRMCEADKARYYTPPKVIIQ